MSDEISNVLQFVSQRQQGSASPNHIPGAQQPRFAVSKTSLLNHTKPTLLQRPLLDDRDQSEPANLEQNRHLACSGKRFPDAFDTDAEDLDDTSVTGSELVHSRAHLRSHSKNITSSGNHDVLVGFDGHHAHQSYGQTRGTRAHDSVYQKKYEEDPEESGGGDSHSDHCVFEPSAEDNPKIVSEELGVRKTPDSRRRAQLGIVRQSLFTPMATTQSHIAANYPVTDLVGTRRPSTPTGTDSPDQTRKDSRKRPLVQNQLYKVCSTDGDLSKTSKDEAENSVGLQSRHRIPPEPSQGPHMLHEHANSQDNSSEKDPLISRHNHFDEPSNPVRSEKDTRGPKIPGGVIFQGRKRSQSLDYDQDQMSLMTYEQLKAEPFDHGPKASYRELPALFVDGSMQEKLGHIYMWRGNDQIDKQRKDFFASLTIDQHESCGDLIIDKFKDMLDKFKQARWEKRKMFQDFEAQLENRQTLVTEKGVIIESDLNAMQKKGKDIISRKGNTAAD
ncbi:uncharacterized protein KY384_003238 [Bacidia gigantensis]|uniref:uncharacterized protein n=1 Tax=Bacidia gigantensis TaxID=2732470 RepID=UPI001D04B839|nr:uncharacterized protein KY384_003238 [Bacidia gigantensis]KAG8531608.1 hypothetical protein KY384_003238 [Bacidia gigantensis]